MDDSCAVCADNLEWVAYGSCGHREVCSTCVVRLRFVLCDPRCCICKTESPVIFVTKALGDYTRTINDFSTFPSAPKEGRVAGGFWYHEDTQAFFDDLDQYRMIKAMCRLSCSVCDKAEEEQGGGGPRHRLRIKSVEQLKGHLYHKHKLNMCNLCLEGRKIFIGEQKLYTRAQLNQHIHTGDSEVDGSESERGGFAGHPMCEFCRNPFYGDNELYTHMTTEHYTCHICQRSQTGKYEYYRNYDDLELHFRRDHFLCEDDSCLSKKFVVFPNESELKRHNAIEHGGRMSRAQRTAALQIPTSFRYSRGNDQESRRGRPRSFRREPGGRDDNYNLAINAALRLSEAEYSRQEPAPPPPSSAPPGFSENNNRDMDDGDPLSQPMESLSTNDMEPSSRYLQAVGSSGGGGSRLQESAFPPLAGQPRSGQNLESLPTNTLAARLRRQTNRTPSATAIASPSQAWPAVNRASNTSGGGGNSSSGWPAIGRTPVVQPSSSSAQSRSHARVAQPRPPNSQAARNGNMIPHSSSAPNLSDTRSLQPSHLDFPPVSSAARKTPSTITQGTSNSQPPPPDVQSANKSLVEKMRSALGHDEDLFMTFKDVSGQYRQGSIDATTYLEYVKGYGLSHLVIDLARLCPDPRRQKELIDAHTASLRNDNGQAAAAAQSSSQAQESQGSKKNKGKAVKVVDPKEAVADNFMETVRRLQSSQNFHEEEEEVISKDKNAYRSDKGKSKVESSSTGSKQQRKKTSKFHRVRLGDGSMAALLNVNSSYHEPEPDSKDGNNNSSNQNQTGVRGVWRKGGAQLFS